MLPDTGRSAEELSQRLLGLHRREDGESDPGGRQGARSAVLLDSGRSAAEL